MSTMDGRPTDSDDDYIYDEYEEEYSDEELEFEEGEEELEDEEEEWADEFDDYEDEGLEEGSRRRRRQEWE